MSPWAVKARRSDKPTLYWVVKLGAWYATGWEQSGGAERVLTKSRRHAFKFTTCRSGPFATGYAFARAYASSLSSYHLRAWAGGAKPRVVRVVGR